MKIEYPAGSTPLDDDEVAALKPGHITTQDQLNEWEAKNIVFEAISLDNRTLKIIVYDDGLGLSTKFLNNPEQVFELGITESSGSGIGLYFVKNIMTNKENINGSIIFLGNNIKLKGACFELTFN